MQVGREDGFLQTGCSIPKIKSGKTGLKEVGESWI